MRDLTESFRAATKAGRLTTARLVKADFDSGPLFLWNGIGELVWNGDTYIGAGHLLQVDPAAETAQTQAQGFSVRLNGMPPALISLALSEPYQGRPITSWLAILNDAGQLLGTHPDFAGFMDVMEIDEGGETATITVTGESRLVDLHRPRISRYTHEDQQIDYPGDQGLIFVPGMQDKQVIWARR